MNVNLKDKTIQLVNGSVIDVVNGCFFPKNTGIVILNDKIISMPGLEGEKELTADYEIDLHGRTVMPGIINTHTHIQKTAAAFPSFHKALKSEKKYQARQIEKRLADCLDYGITIVRDCGTYNRKLSENRNLQFKINCGKLSGPKIMQAVSVNFQGDRTERHGIPGLMQQKIFGRTLGPGCPQSSVTVIPADASEVRIRQVVNTAIDERKADYIKIGQRELLPMSMEQMSILIDQAHTRGKMTAMFNTEADIFMQAASSGVHTVTGIPFDRILSDKEVKTFIDSPCLLEPLLSAHVFRFIWRTAGIPEIKNQYVKKANEYKDSFYPALAENFWINELRPLLAAGKQRIEDRGLKTYMAVTRLVFQKNISGFPVLVENAAKLIDAGALAKISFGNDGGFLLTEANLSVELDMIDMFMGFFGKALSGSDALRVATINGAKVLGMGNIYGSIESGKNADIAVIDGNPLKNYRCLGQKVCALFKDGRLVVNNSGIQIKSRVRLISRSRI